MTAKAESQTRRSGDQPPDEGGGHDSDLEPLRVLEAESASPQYPPFVTSAADRERWDLAVGIAEETFGDDGPAATWSAARVIFSSPIPTWSE